MMGQSLRVWFPMVLLKRISDSHSNRHSKMEICRRLTSVTCLSQTGGGSEVEVGWKWGGSGVEVSHTKNKLLLSG